MKLNRKSVTLLVMGYLLIMSLVPLSLQKKVILKLDNKVTEVLTRYVLVEDLVNEIVGGAPYQMTNDPSRFIEDNQYIEVHTQKQVEILKRGEVIKHETYANDVGTVLNELGYHLTLEEMAENHKSQYKAVSHQLSDALISGEITRIQLVYEEFKEETQVNVTPISVQTRVVTDLEPGEERIVQQGVEAINEHTKTYRYVDGEHVETHDIGAVSIQNGVATIIEKGRVPIDLSTAIGSTWDQLAFCESGGRWDIATGNGYYGGLQFSPSTWRGNAQAVGIDIVNAADATREQQIQVANYIYLNRGFSPWPACSKKLGLR